MLRVKLLRCGIFGACKCCNCIETSPPFKAFISGSWIWHVPAFLLSKNEVEPLSQDSSDTGGFAIQAAGKQLVQLCVGWAPFLVLLAVEGFWLGTENSDGGGYPKPRLNGPCFKSSVKQWILGCRWKENLCMTACALHTHILYNTIYIYIIVSVCGCLLQCAYMSKKSGLFLQNAPKNGSRSSQISNTHGSHASQTRSH